MKKLSFLRWLVLPGLTGLICTTVVHADGMKDRWGIGGFGGQSVPLGPEVVRDRGDVGTVAGGTIRYGLANNWAIGASYENIYLQDNIRREPLTLSALYYYTPDKKWSPVGEFGLGAAASTPSGPFTNMSVKAGIGAEYFVSRLFALGAQLNFHYISDTGKAPYGTWVMTPQALAMFYFGGENAKTAQAAPSAETVALAPMVASFAVTPRVSALGANETRQFQAELNGRPNALVHWTIEPSLGSVSEAGVYTAPHTVALAQQVHVTATSVADPGTSATAIVSLTPPPAAPKEVSIRMEILFDSSDDTVKPTFNGELQRVADFMKSYPDCSAEIDGHSDSTGSAAFNKSLSLRRAESVKQALVSRFGIAESRLTANGYGEEQPLADNKTARGRAQNRRVVAVLKAMEKAQ